VDGKKLAADGYLTSIHKTYYRCAYGTQLYVRVSQRLADRVRTSRKMIPPPSGGSTGANRLHIVIGMRTSDGPVHTYIVIQNCTQTRAGTVLPYTWRQVIFGRLAHHPPQPVCSAVMPPSSHTIAGHFVGKRTICINW
jgi:hypothetical protein